MRGKVGAPGTVARCGWCLAGWVWGARAAGEEVRSNDGKFSLEGTWSFLIRFLCPVAIAALLVYLVWQQMG